MMKVILNRLKIKLNEEMGSTQFSFRKDKGARNAIFSLQTAIDRSLGVQKKVYLVFINYSEYIFKERKERAELYGIKIDGKMMTEIRYADDAILMS